MQKPDISLNIYHARVVAGACWLDAKARAAALAQAWGFNLPNHELQWSMLQEAWVYEILSRREGETR